MRTGKIGLQAFLFERRVPDVMTPVCSCGIDGRETACHVAAYCQLEETTTGVAVRDAHAPKLRDGGKGPYQGGQPDSVAYAEAASGWI
jgi:hypothetical protein